MICPHHFEKTIEYICTASHQCQRKLCVTCHHHHQLKNKNYIVPKAIFNTRLTSLIELYKKTLLTFLKIPFEKTLEKIENMPINKVDKQEFQRKKKFIEMKFNQLIILTKIDPAEASYTELEYFVSIVRGKKRLNDWNAKSEFKQIKKLCDKIDKKYQEMTIQVSLKINKENEANQNEDKVDEVIERAVNQTHDADKITQQNNQANKNEDKVDENKARSNNQTHVADKTTQLMLIKQQSKKIKRIKRNVRLKLMYNQTHNADKTTQLMLIKQQSKIMKLIKMKVRLMKLIQEQLIKLMMLMQQNSKNIMIKQHSKRSKLITIKIGLMLEQIQQHNRRMKLITIKVGLMKLMQEKLIKKNEANYNVKSSIQCKSQCQYKKGSVFNENVKEDYFWGDEPHSRDFVEANQDVSDGEDYSRNEANQDHFQQIQQNLQPQSQIGAYINDNGGEVFQVGFQEYIDNQNLEEFC
ncbi:unnamed protein product [Paramecium sonneborni]|uniref:Uncharacterized protein n=1 Tax=Paramecium sonneborni TaxID=65129 RepID=A0A8S1RFW4_9CILI|nr:unnamed protein product [Paramecium sonneborni]